MSNKMHSASNHLMHCAFFIYTKPKFKQLD